jgi:hypothetical protein
MLRQPVAEPRPHMDETAAGHPSFSFPLNSSCSPSGIVVVILVCLTRPVWMASSPIPGRHRVVTAEPDREDIEKQLLVYCCLGHHIKPVAAKLGFPLKGYHTLRHSYTTLLRQNGNDPKVVQGLLRHASYQITANIYDEAVSPEKRHAHSEVIRLVRPVPQPVPGFGMVES